MLRYQKYIGIIVIIFFYIACGKKTTGPEVSPNYFPLSVGNWWVYSGINLDSLGNEIPGTDWRDSMVIVNQVTREGRQGYMAFVYSSRDTLVDTTFLSSEDGKLYIYLQGHMGDGIPSPRGWVKFADYSLSTWVIWDTNLVNVPIDPNLTTSGTFRWRGEKSSRMNFTIKGREVTAQEFVIRMIYDGTLFKGDQNVGTLSYRGSTRVYNTEGIGLVRWQNDPVEITVRFVVPDTQQGIIREGGERLTLIDYHIR